MRNLWVLLAALATACATTATDPAAQRLESTPRHNEWVQVKNGDRVVQTYVAYPEISTKAPAILIIHENRGLTDFERSVADKLAENGYIAVAPDMLSGLTVTTDDQRREAIGKLPPEQVAGDLKAAGDYAKSIPASNGKLYVGGFCWGGARTWQVANARQDLSGAFVFYGTGPQDEAGIAGVAAPVYGFYGGNDARVNATIPKSEELMKAAGKRFEPVIYEGAGHAFMRAGMAADATEANRKAMQQSWERWLQILGGW